MEDFSKDITEFVKTTKVSAHLVVRKLAFDAYEGVILRSPVDTGRFRANWRITIGGAPDLRVSGPRNKKSAKQKGDPLDSDEETRAQDKINRALFGGTIIISNNLPYAQRLEDGWSGQTNRQPGGILAATFEEIKRRFDETVRVVRSQQGPR